MDFMYCAINIINFTGNIPNTRYRRI